MAGLSRRTGQPKFVPRLPCALRAPCFAVAFPRFSSSRACRPVRSSPPPTDAARRWRIAFDERLPRPDGFVELWREQAFEVFADGEWISGRFDRVTFFETAEGLSAEIIDFKSSVAHPERYDAQLGAYRRAVHALTGIPMARIGARLMQIQA